MKTCPHRPVVCAASLLVCTLTGGGAGAAAAPQAPVLLLDFSRAHPGEVRLVNGARRVEETSGGALEFTHHLQYAEAAFSRKLDGTKALTVGGWFFPRRSGEQYFLFRGLPEVGSLGERMFRRNDRCVNFVLGTDQHGFLLGTINGN